MALNLVCIPLHPHVAAIMMSVLVTAIASYERPIAFAFASGSNNMHAILAVATVASAADVAKYVYTNITVTPWRNCQMLNKATQDYLIRSR